MAQLKDLIVNGKSKFNSTIYTGNILPNGDLLYSIGDSSNRLNEVYASNFVGNADTATCPLYFHVSDNSYWGILTGLPITQWEDDSSGGIAFRTNCPIDGLLSIKVDGRFYLNEGKFICLDEDNYRNFALPLSGGSMTGDIISHNIYPATDLTYNIGAKDSEYINTYSRVVYARHLDADIKWAKDHDNYDLYLGYGVWETSPTKNIYFYNSLGSLTDGVTSRTLEMVINEYGVNVVTFLGVNGLNTNYLLYINGSGNFVGTLYAPTAAYNTNSTQVATTAYCSAKDWILMPARICENIKTACNNNSYYHTGYNSVTFARLFAAGDEANYSTSYDLPCVDSYDMIFLIDGHSKWYNKILSFDIRTSNIYYLSKTGESNWGSWQTLLTSSNYNSYPRKVLASPHWYNNISAQVYKYEGLSTSDYRLPTGYDVVWSGVQGSNRGAAIAIDWRRGRNNVYYNSLHDDTGSFNWKGWTQIWAAGNSITGAIWNDYAEYRESDDIEPGYVLIENGDDTLSKSTKRLLPFAGVSSDTWGFAQGKTDKALTPIAVAGRVLVYPYLDRNNYKSGDCVCAAPGGKVDIMTEEEIMRHPDRIVGIVSCVPTYETWGGGENADRPSVNVDGRIWIRIK